MVIGLSALADCIKTVLRNRLHCCQRIQGLAEILDGKVRWVRASDSGVEGRDFVLTALLQSVALAQVVDDEAAHHPGRIGNEVALIVESPMVCSEIEKGLVQYRGRTQCEREVATQLASRNAMQVGIERGEKIPWWLRLRCCSGICRSGGDCLF
jgi:hypothetical protein